MVPMVLIDSIDRYYRYRSIDSLPIVPSYDQNVRHKSILKDKKYSKQFSIQLPCTQHKISRWQCHEARFPTANSREIQRVASIVQNNARHYIGVVPLKDMSRGKAWCPESRQVKKGKSGVPVPQCSVKQKKNYKKPALCRS